MEGYCTVWEECGLDSVSRMMLVKVWGTRSDVFRTAL